MSLILKLLGAAVAGVPALIVEALIAAARGILFSNDSIRDGAAVVVEQGLRALARWIPGDADDAWLERAIARYKRDAGPS